MMNGEHIIDLVPDYVLELLPPAGRAQVETHAASCEHCRRALLAERQIGPLVRQTLTLATRPQPGRLAALMPRPPQPARSRWTRPLRLPVLAREQLVAVRSFAAALCLMVLLTVGSLQLWQAQYPAGDPSATAIVVTATLAPTATNTVVAGEQPEFEPAIQLVPAPAGTPVAALETAGQN